MNDQQWKFPVHTDVKHVKTGNIYPIIGHGVLEENLLPVYIYGTSYRKLWVRAKSLMEDGRFVNVEEGDE